MECNQNTGSLSITLESKEGRKTKVIPLGIHGESFSNFNAGSKILGEVDRSQWDCGSCCVFEGNKGFMVGIRKDESENKIKVDVIELENMGGHVRRKRINPHDYYDIHHTSGTSCTIFVGWEESGKNRLVGNKTTF